MRIYRRGENWYIDFRFKGQRVRESIGPSRKTADAVIAKRKGWSNGKTWEGKTQGDLSQRRLSMAGFLLPRETLPWEFRSCQYDFREGKTDPEKTGTDRRAGKTQDWQGFIQSVHRRFFRVVEGEQEAEVIVTGWMLIEAPAALLQRSDVIRDQSLPDREIQTLK